jgi:ethanolamine utilization protein EutA
VAFDGDGRLERIEPAARVVAGAIGLHLQLGDTLVEQDRHRLAKCLATCLFEVIARGELSPLARELMLTPPLSSEVPVDRLTFSGGVSEYLHTPETPEYGDIARPLADAIRARLADVKPAAERIRATVIGASQFTVQVSGNTIAISRQDLLPMHNVQVLYPRLPDRQALEPEEITAAIARGFQRFDLIEGEQPVAIAINWAGEPRYSLLRRLALGIVESLPRTVAAGLPIVLVFAHDFGKLIGGIIREEFAPAADIISIDGIELQEFDYIDIGAMIYPSQVVPVVVKSLVFPEVHGEHAEIAGTVALTQ